MKKQGEMHPRVGFCVGFWGGQHIAQKEESLKLVGVPGFFMELLARFELATSSLPRMRSVYAFKNLLS